MISESRIFSMLEQIIAMEKESAKNKMILMNIQKYLSY